MQVYDEDSDNSHEINYLHKLILSEDRRRYIARFERCHNKWHSVREHVYNNAVNLYAVLSVHSHGEHI